MHMKLHYIYVQSIQVHDNLTSHLHANILDVKVLLQLDWGIRLEGML
jgi:hypothetical protein